MAQNLAVSLSILVALGGVAQAAPDSKVTPHDRVVSKWRFDRAARAIDRRASAVPINRYLDGWATKLDRWLDKPVRKVTRDARGLAVSVHEKAQDGFYSRRIRHRGNVLTAVEHSQLRGEPRPSTVLTTWTTLGGGLSVKHERRKGIERQTWLSVGNASAYFSGAAPTPPQLNKVSAALKRLGGTDVGRLEAALNEAGIRHHQIGFLGR